MTSSIKKWAKEQNVYLWAMGLGLFGLVDVLIPGPRVNHLLGGLIVLVAAYMWVVQ